MTKENPHNTESLRVGVYQEFKLASSGHDGYKVARPEGIGIVIEIDGRTVPLFGHTKKGYSAAADALEILKNLTSNTADPKIHRIAFVLAAVGLDTKKGSVMLPSPKMLKDLTAYAGADLKTIDVFAAHGDASHTYTYNLPEPKSGRG
jgi:hypothetical protein